MKQNRYVVCTSCHAMNPSFAAACDQCGAPISEVPVDESSRPTEPVLGTTHFQRPTTLRLIGIWALSVPNVIAGPLFAFQLLKHFHGLAGFILLWGDVGVTGIWLFLFYRVTRSYFFPDLKIELD